MWRNNWEPVRVRTFTDTEIRDTKHRLARLVLENHWTHATCPIWVIEAWADLTEEQQRRGEQLPLFET